MNKTLLDTDTLSELLKRKNRNVILKAAAYLAAFGRFTISTITIMEIVQGLHRLGREQRIQHSITGWTHSAPRHP